MSARQTTWAAMFVALTVLLAQLPGPPGPVGQLFKFVGFPVILAGLVLGPAGGFVVGAVSDVLGYLVHPSGPFFPGFTLTQALTGSLPPLFLRWWLAVVASRSRTRGTAAAMLPGPTFWNLTLSLLAAKLISSITLVSLFRSYLFGTPFWWHWWAALGVALVHCPLYAWACLPLMGRLSRRIQSESSARGS